VLESSVQEEMKLKLMIELTDEIDVGVGMMYGVELMLLLE
jgi:hypothetical protein